MRKVMVHVGVRNAQSRKSLLEMPECRSSSEAQRERGGVLGSAPGRHRHLGPRDRERHDHAAALGLPEQVADLVVEGRHVAGLHHVLVVAQAVEQLRSVGRGIDRLEVPGLDVDLALGPVGDGMDVDTLLAEPAAGQGT